jgi:chromosome segregation ATPase
MYFGSGLNTVDGSVYPSPFLPREIQLSNDIESNPGPETETTTLAEMNKKLDKLDRILDRLDDLDKKWQAVDRRVASLEEEVESTKATMENMETKLNKIDLVDGSLKNARDELEHAKQTIKSLQESMDEQEDRARRSNIIFDGVVGSPTEKWEEAERKVREVIREKLELEDDDIEFDRVHRIQNGPKTNNSVPIIAKFNKFKDKQTVMSKMEKLKKTGIYMHDDYCKNTRLLQNKKCL